MNMQLAFDGVLLGSVIALGAIGVTLTYSIMRFANFAHGEFIAWGAYLSYAIAGWWGATSQPIGELSFGWALIAALLASFFVTGTLSLVLDRLVFSRLRASNTRMVVVMASFGISLSLRSLLELLFGAQPQYFSRDLQIAMPIIGDIRATPDQLAAIAVMIAMVIAVHFILTRTHIGLSMRAAGENGGLARVAGINTRVAVYATCLLGGGLAAVAGTMSGVLTQVRPQMGFELLLSLFSAAILGGLGSVQGAVLGGLIVGISESLAVAWIGGEYRSAAAFIVLISVLLLRPNGIFGARA
ncbi:MULTISPECIES: branched-chain amino acid ABC transporter permease [unclassified Caballeronia]|uniref:branched-chain amino acid ABC transporter permease n=1 Tax=unclassified Caballeronia TaxID=2646786 RepID=UPI001F40CB88|nr:MULTISPECIES: branched-chain amino acid ABC transporter permease [unclassified Caballeronia]MCE4548176.1 branched-chain amino acid ABC transporter permease [Caballeronia sp. PC1]MCE4575841.1 branched-chain amino acid ABC transporter permease [Caballeronia sp. CLC5]